MKIFNSLKSKGKAADQSWLQLRMTNDASTPAEILMYEPIGKDPWGESGISSKNFKAILDQVPKDRELHIRINSRGGDVYEGFTIKSMLDEWPSKVTCTIDGVAASTASWVCAGCDEVKASRNSQMFLHDAMTIGMGNAADLRKAADMLDTTSDQIAGIYSEKCGKGVRTMRQMMKDETLLTGEEAEDLGLVDTLIEARAIHNFTPAELDEMKSRLAAQRNSVAGTGAGAATNISEQMNKQKIIALLNKHGVTQINGVKISEATPDEHLEAALEQVLNAKKTDAEQPKADPAKAQQQQNTEDLSAIRNELKLLREANESLIKVNNEGRKARVTQEIEILVVNDQLPEVLKQQAIDDCVANDGRLENFYKKLPSRAPGAEPLPANKIECVSEAFNDIQNFVLENGPRFREKFIGKNAGRPVDKMVCAEIGARALAVANAIVKHRGKIVEAWNANAIDAALQRQVILQDMIEAYATIFARLDVFSTIYNSIPLEGTDKVEVPYFPLQTNAAVSFVKGTGYTTARDWTQNSREISIGGDGDSTASGTSAAANTARDRKYIMVNFYSYDMRRQPYLNLTKLFQQAANKLAVDIVSDIIGRVVTLGNFGAGLIGKAAASFAGDDVADLRETATGLMWPQMGRSLVLDHTYYTPLLKDPTFKQYLSYGATDPLHQGVIRNAYGFDNIVEFPSLTSYAKAGEKMVGWINHKSAVLIATSPIMPTEEVRNLLTRYDVIIEPKTGAAFEYKRFGDAVKDQTSEVAECSYGAAKGVDAALQRMVGP
jgi:ATP-dependent protease ClpP protease subunit